MPKKNVVCPWAYQFRPSPLLRSVQGLEQAIETLDAQFQACELVKLDVGSLSNKNLPEPDQKWSLGGKWWKYVSRDLILKKCY